MNVDQFYLSAIKPYLYNSFGLMKCKPGRPKKGSNCKRSVQRSVKRVQRVQRKSIKRVKRSFKGDHNIYKPERGCIRQTNKKYSNRPGPPYPANLCRNRLRRGNDGMTYKSKEAYSKGKRYFKWIKV